MIKTTHPTQLLDALTQIRYYEDQTKLPLSERGVYIGISGDEKRNSDYVCDCEIKRNFDKALTALRSDKELRQKLITALYEVI